MDTLTIRVEGEARGDGVWVGEPISVVDLFNTISLLLRSVVLCGLRLCTEMVMMVG